MRIFNIILFIVCVFSFTVFAETIDYNELKSIADNLKQKEEMLNKKEAELNKKEQELKSFEQSLIEKEKELIAIRAKLEELYNKIRVVEDENLDKLAKVYGSTKAKSAAKAIVKMELDKAVSLFQKMAPMTAGKILTEIANIDSEFASKISERLTPTKNKLK
ncbi:MAG: hypothetical protein JG762_588 [Deferribacteraceae bacterium]|jgi:flagellar motility protein MotE (MotC chaperone)|nr:hypothetical protein [Deferribacteraceae bacterium]